MSDHAIILTDWEARAFIEGRITQIRRPVIPPPDPKYNDDNKWYADSYNHTAQWCFWGKRGTDVENICGLPLFKCPFGVPGDVIWGREAWQAFRPQAERLGGRSVFAGATIRIYAYPPIEGNSVIDYRADRDPKRNYGSWRSSTSMPRWAARTIREVVAVRVERVQEIDSKNALVCGWPRHEELFSATNTESKARNWFEHLWDARYAAKGFGWDANPWVWVADLGAKP